MSFNLVLQSEAVIDMHEAFEWYEAQKPGLGHELIIEIEEGLQKICSYPLRYTPINNRFRRLKVNRFPYLIVYETNLTDVMVVAVRHTKRKLIF